MLTNSYTENERYQIANTIWQQLGTQRFALATGCKPECYGEKDNKVFLLMSVGKNDKGITLFEVSYNEGADLYEARFMSKTGETAHVVASYNDVYCDMLHTLFTQHTGISVGFNIAA